MYPDWGAAPNDLATNPRSFAQPLQVLTVLHCLLARTG
jgi:hypothetical protein